MEFKVGDWVVASHGVRQIDAITPSGQIRVGHDRYKHDKWGECRLMGWTCRGTAPRLRHATEAEIAARKLELELQREREVIQKARAKMAREFLLMLNWESVSDAQVLRIAEQQGFKG